MSGKRRKKAEEKCLCTSVFGFSECAWSKPAKTRRATKKASNTAPKSDKDDSEEGT